MKCCEPDLILLESQSEPTFLLFSIFLLKLDSLTTRKRVTQPNSSSSDLLSNVNPALYRLYTRYSTPARQSGAITKPSSTRQGVEHASPIAYSHIARSMADLSNVL